jgi:hypothetical protein
MKHVLIGFIAGAISGTVMGFISDVCFRLGIFKSSLIVIDGSFLFRTLKLRNAPLGTYIAGIIIHLVTSGIFGLLYLLAAGLLEFNALSFANVSVYVVLLWLSMLFVALPISGEGILGRKSGSLVWLEQFALHILFSGLYYWALILLP